MHPSAASPNATDLAASRWQGLDLDRLATCYLVARQGSMKKAAALLGLTVPAVSMRVSRLERDLEVQLFRRLPHKLELTPVGQAFLDEIGAVLQHLDEAVAIVRAAHVERKSIVLSLGSSMMTLISRQVAQFIGNHPDVDVSIQIHGSAATAALVVGETADIGIGYFGDVPDGLEPIPLGWGTVSFLCHRGHPLGGEQGITLEQIVTSRLVMIPGDSELRRSLLRAIAPLAPEALDITEVGSCQSAIDLAASGGGVAVVHASCAREMPASACLLEPDRPLAPLALSMLVRSGQQPAHVQALIDAFRADPPQLQASASRG